MPGINYPPQYLVFNRQLSKNLAIVMQIEGIDTLFGISDTFTRVKYGDPGLVYGLPGLVYGGLRRISGAGGTSSIKPYIVLDSSMTISQKIEPEQGKGNVSTLTMTLIDKNGEVSRMITPGIVVDEIMTSKEVKIYIGFAQTSFPEDYLLLYRGYITQLQCPPSVVKFQLSDATTKKRQPIFNTPTTVLTSPIDAVTTTIPVLNTSGFHQQILGPDGSFDSIVETYILIDQEWMQYGSAGIVSPTQFTVTRGGSSSLGTTPAPHDIGASVSNGVRFGQNAIGVNFITLILKLLLSGWNGPCETGITLFSFVYTQDPTLGFQNNAFVLAVDDALLDLGLTVGDYFTISGATNLGNDISGKITSFSKLNIRTAIIFTDQTFILENPTPATVSFRSKYDTLPVTCGAKCRMRDVDVETFETIRSKYFSVATFSAIQIFYDSPQYAKDAIDTDITLPMGCYGISRFGRISLSITKPPLPNGPQPVTLDWTNVLDPDKIVVTRATNNRNFWNLINFQYDFNIPTQNFDAVQYFLDTNSLNLFQQTSQLSINAPGLQSSLGGATIAQTRGNALLNRYKMGALLLELTVNWSVGSLIEVSDTVILNDSGHLKIMNFQTGERNLGIQMFEVIERQYNVTSGNVKLTLLSGLGFDVSSRFALYSPSSLIDTGATSSQLRIKPSFGQTGLTAELAKWTPFLNLRVQVHSYDWSTLGVSTIVGFTGDSILIDPPLAFTPSVDDLVDINSYPTSTNKNEDAAYKNLYCHITPTIPVVSGVSGTQFNVSLGDAANMTVGNSVIVRKFDYTVISAEIVVQSIVGTLVTLEKNLGFTPTSSYFVEGIGFKDGTSFYRWD